MNIDTKFDIDQIVYIINKDTNPKYTRTVKTKVVQINVNISKKQLISSRYVLKDYRFSKTFYERNENEISLLETYEK